MEDCKTIFESKTVLAAIVAFVASIGSIFGHDLSTADQQTLVTIVTSAVAAAASLGAIWGRVKAKSKIMSKADAITAAVESGVGVVEAVAKK